MSTEGLRSAKSTERRTRRAGGRAKKAEEGPTASRGHRDRKPDVRTPSRDAIDYCREQFGGSREVYCPVRRQFVSVTNPGAKSVLRQVLAGGGEVRLKMYLTALWWATSEPHNIEDVPASAWARAFGLDRYSTAGAKRVLDATTWLTDHQLMRSARTRGAPAKLQLLREDGSGDPYHRPWWGHERDEHERLPIPDEDLYFQIPKEFWEAGWVSVLSGPAVMCLCIHLAATWGWKANGYAERTSKEDDRPARLKWHHFTEAERRDRFTVSEDTWRRGNHELVAWGLVGRRARWNSGFKTRRQYFEYQVDLEKFERSPLDVTPVPVRVTMIGGGGAPQ